jgi:DNA polymerase III alpha subunit
LFISVVKFSLLWNRFQAELSEIDANDPTPLAMPRKSGTIRAFQLDSPTQRDKPRRLALNHFEDFMVSTCLVRPGPLKLNMTRHGKKPMTYLHHQPLSLLYSLNQANQPYYTSWLKPNK